jgi:hypothetical protein
MANTLAESGWICQFLTITLREPPPISLIYLFLLSFEIFASFAPLRRGSAEPLTLLLTTGPFFMIIRPRATTLPRATSLAEFAADKKDDELRKIVDFEISSDRRDGGDSAWQIELSTLPWKQGKTISASGK